MIDINQDLACLFNEKLISEKFLEAKKEYYPKTTKWYLMSLCHFYSFCLREDNGITVSEEKVLSHSLPKCQTFERKTFEGRLQIMGNAHLCHNCFKYGHTAVRCLAKSACQVDGCKRHHTLDTSHPSRRREGVPESSSCESTNTWC